MLSYISTAVNTLALKFLLPTGRTEARRCRGSLRDLVSGEEPADVALLGQA